MFSGIVEEIGSIYQTELINEGVRFYVSCSKVNKDVRIGDSIAIDGVCQTIVGIDSDKLIFEAVGITLEKTTLGEIKPKDHNLDIYVDHKFMESRNKKKELRNKINLSKDKKIRIQLKK